MIHCDNDKITKIPGSVCILGDMRATPFYYIASVLRDASAYVGALNARIHAGARIAGFPRVRTNDGVTGTLELVSEGKLTEGIACDLDSPALRALTCAIADVRGASAVKAYSMTGSLPLVRDLQRRGFDVQITGFGESRSYHAPNEQAQLQDFEDGLCILESLIAQSTNGDRPRTYDR